MPFLVSDLKRPKLGVLLFRGPTEAAPGEPDNANHDQNDPDNSSWFHNADAIAAAGRQSIG